MVFWLPLFTLLTQKSAVYQRKRLCVNLLLVVKHSVTILRKYIA